VAIELPNRVRQTVHLRDVLDTDAFRASHRVLSMALGQDIAGEPVVVNLASMPHLLLAGAAGSGQSVGINAMLVSMLYKASPDQLRFIMLDGKQARLTAYDGIPHLLTNIITESSDAEQALDWCVAEMDRRYQLMAALGVRHLSGYTSKVLAAIDADEPLRDPLWQPIVSTDGEAPELDLLPNIVIVVSELAELMMVAGKPAEELLVHLAQKARAAGIHLILATQRPTAEVITGLLKAAMPTRIAFQTASKLDARTILDQVGAESLLGMGDQLYMPAGSNEPMRIHGALITPDEVHKVVAEWQRRGKPIYCADILGGELGGERHP
jgi:S-DNA-T family DNA segregation ATPase FtsK/SpoIIIE